jgi:hypothetical protein
MGGGVKICPFLSVVSGQLYCAKQRKGIEKSQCREYCRYNVGSELSYKAKVRFYDQTYYKTKFV